MVLEDIFARKSKPSDSIKAVDPTLEPFEKRLASPADRLAAVVADFIIFGPVLTLIVSPLRKQAVEAQMTGNDTAWTAALISVFALTGLAVLFYQTFFVSYFGGTPGKLALGLRVISVWHKGHPRPLESFIRSFVWVIEIFLAGAPWLAVFANERRRPFHDRTADTAVISIKKNKQAGPASFTEISIASGFQTAILAVLALIVTIHLFENQAEKASENWIISEMEEKGSLCREVRAAHTEWLLNEGRKKSDKSVSRMNVALTLHSTGSIDDECLRAEADFSLWRDDDKLLAYLGKGMAESADNELREKYFDKVCEIDSESDACKVVVLMEGPGAVSINEIAGEDMNQKTAEVEQENRVIGIVDSITPGSSLFLKVAVIRYLMEQRQFVKAIEIMDTPAPERLVAAFFASERTKALWLSGNEEKSKTAFSFAIELSEHYERVDLSQWFCWNETFAKGCSDNSRLSCEILTQAVSESPKWLMEDDVAAAFIRAETCKDDSVEHMETLNQKVTSSEAKAYLKALMMLAGENAKKGHAVIENLATGARGRGRFFIEAILYSSEKATSKSELQAISEKWQEIPPATEGWKIIGLRLMDKLASLGEWDSSIQVGLRIAEIDAQDSQLFRSLVVMSHRAGQTSMALGFLDRVRSIESPILEEADFQETARRSSRTPASGDAFEEIVKDLNRAVKANPSILNLDSMNGRENQ